jgi:carbon-monoxide dehydrogenase medium subunit
VACCLDASLVIAGPGGTRTTPARDFYLGAMTTSLSPDEIVTAVRLPASGPGEGFGFAEVARRHGDFALAGVVTHVRGDGAATLTGFGVSDRPVTRSVSGELADAARASGADAGPLADALPLAAALAGPLAPVADQMADTAGDAHASRDYRRRLLRFLASRELALAYQRARALP